MKEENQNSWQNISDRLDGIESLPGEAPFDRDIAWTAVEQRLHPDKKRAAFWWAAAALLICSGATFLFRYASPRPVPGLSNRVNVPDAKKPGNAVPSTATVPATRIPRTTTPAVVSHKVSLTVNPDRRTASAGRKFFQQVRKTQPQTNAVTVNRPDKEADSVQAGVPENLLPLPGPDSDRHIAGAGKPLRVVYLNELEEPGFPETGLDNAVKNNPASSRLRFPIGYFNGPASTTANPGLSSPRNSFFRINLDR